MSNKKPVYQLLKNGRFDNLSSDNNDDVYTDDGGSDDFVEEVWTSKTRGIGQGIRWMAEALF